jgi:8-oxo-dGTP pyrophosphatase MutT (NUDIX family)
MPVKQNNLTMNFSQRIYFNDTPLILTTSRKDYLHENPGAEQYDFFKGASLRSYEDVLQKLEKPGAKGAIVEDISADILMKKLQAMFHQIDAGGGVAYNEKGEVLMIFRRGKWDLPKGKSDEGETIEECALREVREETGLKKLTLGEKIGDTWHIYLQKNEQILKRTAWYKMHGISTEKLKPQKEENILEARWVSAQNIAPLAAQSYEAVRDVLKLAGVKW